MNTPAFLGPLQPREYLSDLIMQAIRSRDMSQLADLSPAAACLAPLLLSLGMEDRVSEIIEALPVRQNDFDLTDLRNVLVNLGISTEPHSLQHNEIQDALLPCILVDRDDNLYVVTTCESQGYMIYVASQDKYELGALPDNIVTALYFTDMRTEVDQAEIKTRTTWLGRITSRFNGLLSQVLFMSLVINLLALTPPLFILAVYDGVIGAQYTRALPYLLTGIVMALLVESALRWLRALAIGHMTSRMDFLVATESFRHLLRLPPMAVERSDLGTQLGHLKQFDSVRDFLAGPNMILLMELPFIPIYVLVVALIAGPVFWVPAGMLLTFALCGYVSARTSALKTETGQQHRAHRNQMMFELLSGINDIKSHRSQQPWLERVREADTRAMGAKLHDASQQATLRNLGIAITAAAGILTLWTGALLIMEDAMGVGALIATMVIVWRIGGLAQSLLALAPRISPLLGSIRHINNVMDVPEEKRSASANMLIEKASGKVEFDKVHFRFDAESNPALYSCSFSVEPGDLIALTGLSGSGKSTILKLIAGLYRPQSGSIYVDGVDVRQLDPQGLRHMLSYLPHEKHLLQGSVADNIRLSQPDATDEQVIRATSEANALGLIRSLPAGFNTRIDSNTPLSSSVINGICLARTFLRECPILLLDEPGENFDNEADQRLTQRLAERKGKQTIIMATHRPSQIALASRVIVLDNGQLITT